MTMNTLHFTKMHGNGNDFIVVNAIAQTIVPTRALCQALGNRYFGIGADQLLWVEAAKSDDPETPDFVYRIFNADGQEVETCGNGARAFLRFLRSKNLSAKKSVRVRTKAGILILSELDDAATPGWIEVNMGVPRFTPSEIPFNPDGAQPDGVLWIIKNEDSRVNPLSFFTLSMGNPHAVAVLNQFTTTELTLWGEHLQKHPAFPAAVNLGFMKIHHRHAIDLRVFERGVGETLSCGSGACAAVVAGISQGLLDSPVMVNTRGGPLRITWSGAAAPVMMAGDAVIVFDGHIELQQKWLS